MRGVWAQGCGIARTDKGVVIARRKRATATALPLVPKDTWDLFSLRFIVEQQPDGKFRVLVHSRIGKTLIGARLIKSGASDTSYPELDYDFDAEPEAQQRAQEWRDYVIRSWPRRDK